MKNNDNVFAYVWNNRRLRSLIFLIFWVIFIVFLFVKYAIPYEKSLANQTNNTTLEKEEETGETEITFLDLKNSLLRYNFEYIYTVTTPTEKIIYKGTMLANETIGYKESSMGIEKYYINGMQIYKDVLGERVLQADKNTDVYNGYLSVDKIMDLLTGQNYNYSDNQYDFQINEVYVKISVAEDNISKIEILNGNDNYLLEFSSVNEINSLNY